MAEEQSRITRWLELIGAVEARAAELNAPKRQVEEAGAKRDGGE